MTRPALSRLFFVSICAALTPWATPAQAQDSSIEAREAAMFGEPEDEADEAEEEVDEDVEDDDAEDSEMDAIDAREAAIFGADDSDPIEEREASIFGGDEGGAIPSAQVASEPSSSQLGDELSARLAAREAQSLDIGGSLFSQLYYTVLDSGDPAEFPLTQPNLFDVYLDARPSNRLRVYADARLTYIPTTSAEAGVGGTGTGAPSTNPFGAGAEALRAELDQLWIKFDLARTIYVTAGRQHLRWGVGRFWYPNDFLFEQRRDPLALVDARTGVDLLKLHLPIESKGWNFYAIANLGGADSPKTVGAAGRAELLLGTTEVGLSAAAQKDKPTQLGADISSALGWFDLRAAATLLHNVETPFFRGDSNFTQFERIDLDNIAELQIPERYSRADDWIPRALVGAEVGIPILEEDTIYVGAEYFFNGAGYSDADLYPWMILNGAFRPLYSGRHYAAFYALAPSPGDWNDTTFTFSTLGNLSDLSFLSRLDYSVRVLSYMRVFAYTSITYGKPGEFRLGLRVPSISSDVLDAAAASGQFGVPPGVALDDGFPGLLVPATRAMIGGGLSLNF